MDQIHAWYQPALYSDLSCRIALPAHQICVPQKIKNEGLLIFVE